MIVVDASALLEALLGTPLAVAVNDRLFDRRETLHAPHLLDVEVAQVIRRYTINAQITAERAVAALADFLDLPLHRHPHDFLMPRAWELRNNFTTYDAVYVALAEVLDAPLLTHDRRLAAAAGHRVRIELV
jgi:predicted nucleic acid-binding protein